MHSATIFFALACVAAASASGLGHDLHAIPNYKFNYAVADKHTGDQKSAAEVRHGDVTKGSYSLVQPDGVLRTVNYIVTPHGGFQAQVINKGVAGHPAIYGKGLGLGAGIGLGAGHLGGARSVIGSAGLGHGLGLGLGSGLGLGAGLGLGVGQLGGLGLGLGGASSVVGGLGSPLGGGLGVGLGDGLGWLG